MVRTVSFDADIPDSRELRITLPADVPTGSAAIVITVSPRRRRGETRNHMYKTSLFMV